MNSGIMKPWVRHTVASLLIVLFLLQALLSMQQMSMATDENIDIAAGYSYWKTRDGRMNYEHPPLIKMLATLPLLFLNLKVPTDHPSWRQVDQTPFSRVFLHQDDGKLGQVLFLSRTSIVFLAVLLAIYVLKWASELWGPEAGLAALFLFVFEPNILAYSRLVTMDLGVTAFTFISVYYLWKWLETGNRRYGVVTSTMLGCSLLSKYSALVLLPICFVEFAVHRYTRRFAGNEPRGVTVWGFLRILVGSVLVVIAVYALAFHWHPLLHPGGEHKSLPKLVARLPLANAPGVQMKLIALGEKLPIPSVDLYLAGVLGQRQHLAAGNPAFLMGHHSNHGWWYYYLAAFMIKTPIPILLLMVIRLLSLRRDRLDVPELFVVLPAVGFMAASFLSLVARGLQYVLPVYPFLFVWLSRIIAPAIFGRSAPADVGVGSAARLQGTM